MEDEKKREKIRYSVPRLAPLSQGDRMVSEGSGCSSGGSFNTGTCNPGGNADECSSGSSVVYCHNGSHAVGSGCSSGGDATGHYCSLGSLVWSGCSSGNTPSPP
jgi:hypothetical protein